mmetsp:Transcript_18772/g.30671  ORF Transcript_18772/g.30671 Transcript_18772/m.30671 type:complete len:281 (-) Transcript_18772:1444-2286(-)
MRKYEDERYREANIRRENGLLKKRLEKIYNRTYDKTFKPKTQGGQSIDCRKRWQQRTDIYDENNNQSRRTKNGVPKSIGVAVCAVTGKRSYYKADGPKMTRDKNQGKFYSSLEAKRLDQEDSKDWVVNESLAWARKQLQKEKGQRPDINSLLDMYEKRRRKELKKEGKKLANKKKLHNESRLEDVRLSESKQDEGDTALKKLKENLHARGGSKSTRRILQEAFRNVDTNYNGEISREEFTKATGSFLNGYDSSTVDTLFEKIDTNKNGSISLAEFVEHLE